MSTLDGCRNIVGGIDPGKKGAIAWHNLLTGKTEVVPMPLVNGEEIDEPGIRALFAERVFPNLDAQSGVEEAPGLVVIEKVNAMPDQGVVSMFHFGEGYGLIRGILVGLKIPYIRIAPQTWKKEILRGTPKDKTAAICYVKARYPGVSLKRSSHPACKDNDGMADAVCIMEYGVTKCRDLRTSE